LSRTVVKCDAAGGQESAGDGGRPKRFPIRTAQAAKGMNGEIRAPLLLFLAFVHCLPDVYDLTHPNTTRSSFVSYVSRHRSMRCYYTAPQMAQVRAHNVPTPRQHCAGPHIYLTPRRQPPPPHELAWKRFLKVFEVPLLA